MSGARYDGWHHTHIVGADRAAGLPYLAEARKLLGYVWQEAGRLQLGSYSLRRQLADGTVIVAEKIGEIPRITIVPVSSSRKTEEDAQDAFVVWARNAGLPQGIDATYPQQILRNTDDVWRTYCYSQDQLTAGARGTYGGTLPKGIRHAGNIDWRGADGERVSWYGPSNRLFNDPFVFARSQFHWRVFYLGSVLLDVEEYQAAAAEAGQSDSWDSYKWVMGACLRNVDGVRWLYVIQTYLPASTQTTPDTVEPGAVLCSTPLQGANNNEILMRYRLVENTDVADVASRWKVLSGSREAVFGWGRPRMLQPWRFNETGTRASTTAPLEDDQHVTVFQLNTDTDEYEFTTPPATSCTRYTLDLDELTLAETALSIEGSDSWVELAVDFGRDSEDDESDHARALEAGRTVVEGFADPVLAFRFDGVVVPLLANRIDPEEEGLVLHSEQNCLLYGNPRDQVYVFLHIESNGTVVLGQDANADDPIEWTSRIHMYRRGKQIADVASKSTRGRPAALDISPFVYDVVAGRLYQVHPLGTFINARLADRAVSPLHLVHGVWLLGNILDFEADDQTWTFGHDVCFLGTLFSRTPWPAEHYFGQFLSNTQATAQPALLVSGSSLAGFDTDKEDFDDRPCVLACATIDETTLYSGPGFSGAFDSAGVTSIGVTGEGISYADRATLAQLTAVGGQQARYHPLWALGKPIKES